MPEACTVFAVAGAVAAAVVAVAGSSVEEVAAGGYAAEGVVADEHGGSAGVRSESSDRRTAIEAGARNTGCSGEAIERPDRGLGRRRQEVEAGAEMSW